MIDYVDPYVRSADHLELLSVGPWQHLAPLVAAGLAGLDLRARTAVELGRGPVSAPASMINSLGHLDPDARQALWGAIAAGVTADGCAVINLQQPTTASAVPRFEMSREQVGDRTYHGSAWAERVDDATMTWHMTYRTSVGNNEIDTVDVEYRWHVTDRETLEDELLRHRLRTTVVGDEQWGMFRIESAA